MELPNDFKRCLRLFVYYYTNGTLQFVIEDGRLLAGIDYREVLQYEASVVETVFAIYCNNIKMDNNGKVLNQSYSMKRAAQYIRLFCCQEDEDYKIEPPFEEWEIKLH